MKVSINILKFDQPNLNRDTIAKNAKINIRGICKNYHSGEDGVMVIDDFKLEGVSICPD